MEVISMLVESRRHNLPNSINSKQVGGDFDGILAHLTKGGVLGSGDAKYTDGNITNYSVKTTGGNVITVGQADIPMTPFDSGLYYYNGTSSGNTDGCFSIHSADLSTTIHNSFLGGNTEDAACDVQIAPNNHIFITGGTNSSDFPCYNLSGSFNNSGAATGGVWLYDNFISCIACGNTNLAQSTYLGNNWQGSSFYPVNMNTGNYLDITTCAVTSQNGLYVLGGSNSYNTFPLDEWYGVPTYFQPT